MRWNGRLLILAHVKELLQQNDVKLHRLAPNIDFGIYSAGIKELINEGFLCRIHTRVPTTKIDCSNIHIRNGEFRADEVAERFSTEEAVPTRLTVIKTSWQRFEEVIEHDFTEKPELPDTYDEEPKVCGDCGLFYQGDCPHATEMFGEEPACEHFLSESANNLNDDIPF